MNVGYFSVNGTSSLCLQMSMSNSE